MQLLKLKDAVLKHSQHQTLTYFNFRDAIRNSGEGPYSFVPFLFFFYFVCTWTSSEV